MNSHSINVKIPMQLYDAEGQENFMYIWKSFPKKPVLEAIALSVTKTTLSVKDHDGPDVLDGHHGIENVEEKNKSENHSEGMSGPGPLLKKVKIEQGLQPCLDDVYALARGEAGRPWHKAIDILKVCKAHRTIEFVEWMCQTNPKIGRTQMEEVWKRPESDSPEKDIELFLKFLKAKDPDLGTIKTEVEQSHDKVKAPPGSVVDILVGEEQDKKEDEPEEPTTAVGQDKKDKEKEDEGMAPDALAPTIRADAGGEVADQHQTEKDTVPEDLRQKNDDKIMAPTPTTTVANPPAPSEALVEGPLQEQDDKIMANPAEAAAEADGVVGDDKTEEGKEEKDDKIMAPTPPTIFAEAAAGQDETEEGKEKMPEGPPEKDDKMMAPTTSTSPAEAAAGQDKTEEGKEKVPEGPPEKDAAEGVGAAAPKGPALQESLLEPLEQEKAALSKLVLKGDNGLCLG